jgi:hypothetical protein
MRRQGGAAARLSWLGVHCSSPAQPAQRRPPPHDSRGGQDVGDAQPASARLGDRAAATGAPRAAPAAGAVQTQQRRACALPAHLSGRRRPAARPRCGGGCCAFLPRARARTHGSSGGTQRQRRDHRPPRSRRRGGGGGRGSAGKPRPQRGSLSQQRSAAGGCCCCSGGGGALEAEAEAEAAAAARRRCCGTHTAGLPPLPAAAATPCWCSSCC